MKIGFIGLGRMGKNIVLNLLEHNIEVVAWNRSSDAIEELKFKIQNSKFKIATQNLKFSKTIEELVKSLKKPRIVWLMVTAGEATQNVLDEVSKYVQKDDIIVDAGNSFYQDSLKRNKLLSKKGLHFMDVGTSGGVESARSGACLMVGGTKEDFDKIEPVLKALAAPQGYGLLGPVGAGHFAKMVHNGIEYGMMEAIGEGAAILKNCQFNYDLREVFRVYNIRSIIESRLVGWTYAELKNDPHLSNISSVIGSAGGGGKAKGEGHWTVELTRKMGFKVPVIEASVKVRDESDKDLENSPSGFRNKIVAAMRWQFGRHPVKK